jgi:hypothetical protein
MSLEQLGLTLQQVALFSAVRESAFVYPALLAIHLTCLALFGGAILATDLRLLRWTLTSVPLSEVIDRLRPWKYAGLSIMVAAGALVAGSRASEYFVNTYFQTKMALLGLIAVDAAVFRQSVYRDAAHADGTPRARLAAIASLILWTGVLSMGRWIAYFD